MRENEGELERSRGRFSVAPLLHNRTRGDSEGAESKHTGRRQTPSSHFFAPSLSPVAPSHLVRSRLHRVRRRAMSNKAVPTVYRTIIDSVIENVRPDFDELGVEEAVLQELLRSWEHKVAISRVADFSGDPVMAPAAREFPPLPNPPPFHPRSRPSSSTTHTAVRHPSIPPHTP